MLRAYPKLMAWTSRWILLALVFAPWGVQATSIDDFLDQQVKTESSLDLSQFNALYNQIVLDKSFEDAVANLKQFSTDANNSSIHRAKSLLTLAHLQWRHGLRDEALEAIDQSLQIHSTEGGQYMKGRLLDASGKTQDAVLWYEQVADSTADPNEREITHLRLAMIDADVDNIDALTAFAKSGDQERKNQVAIVLAILDHTAQALELFNPIVDAKKYTSQLLRQTEWSIEIEDFTTAQTSAWQAYDSATTGVDRLYALALLEEAYKKGEDLPAFLVALEEREPLSEELRQLQIDQFIALQQYENAIDLYLRLAEEDSSTEVRQRLLSLYTLANRHSELEEEYAKLLAAYPEEVAWYKGLSSHYLLTAQTSKVQDLWGRFVNLNSSDPDSLAEGAEAMLRFGLEEEAIQYVEAHLNDRGPSTQLFLFLFETHLNKGRQDVAKSVVERFEESLPAGSKDLHAVADCYERISEFAAARDVFLDIEKARGRLDYDQRNRLAWLMTISGQKEQALTLWKEIWLSASSAARRSFAESQLLLLAAELNRLGDLVVELEQKLYANQADQNELNLLVRIYREVGDTFSATEVIQEFADRQSMSEIELQRQLASTYLQMQEYGEYEKVLRELVEIDVENRAEHIQNIILSLVIAENDSSDDRLLEIQTWVSQLQAIDQDAVNSEFLASVLAMSGYVEEAIQRYQLALIEEPLHSDNLLLMTELMKEMGQTERAVNMLQYIAEHSVDDNEFVVAVDGIINMIGQPEFGADLLSEHKRTFRWTFRTILERIATKADKIYLYTLLADIAQEIGDKESEYTSLESSVSLAGLRRPAILRELFTMASPGEGFTFMSRNVSDPVRQLRFGQRLIGLRQQLPPSVFIALSKTLLNNEDMLGAERALDQINDVTGMIDISQTKGELFYDAGHSNTALRHYVEAEVLDQDNLELATKTTAIRELAGQTQTAHVAYLRIIEKIVQSQLVWLDQSRLPAQNPGNLPRFQEARDTSLSSDYRYYYEFLLQGLFSTFESGESNRENLLQHAREIFDNALNNSVPYFSTSESKQLAVFPRLKVATEHVRRIAYFTDDLPLYRYVNTQLQLHLADDDVVKSMPEEQNTHWLTQNSESSTSDTDVQTTINRWIKSLVKERHLDQAVRFAVHEDDTQAIQTLLTESLEQGEIIDTLSLAIRILDDEELKRFVSFVVSKLSERPDDLLVLFSQGQYLVSHIEQKIGLQLSEVDQILSLFKDTVAKSAKSKPIQYSDFSNLMALSNYVYTKGNLRQKLDLLENLNSVPSDSLITGLSAELYGLLVLEVLDHNERSRLNSIMLRRIDDIDFTQFGLSRGLIPQILARSIPKENWELHQTITDEWITRGQIGEHIALARDYLYAEEHDKALDHLLEFLQSDGDDFRRRSILDEVWNTIKDAIDQRFLMIAEVPSTDVNAVRSLYLMTYPDDTYLRGDSSASESASIQEIERLELMIKNFPDVEEFRRYLILSFFDLQDQAGITTSLADYYQFDPSETYIRAAYYFNLIKNERFVDAQSVLEDGREDLSNSNVVETMKEAIEEKYSSSRSSSAEIFKMVLDIEEDFFGRSGVSWSKSTKEAVKTLTQSTTSTDDVDLIQQIIALKRAISLDLIKNPDNLYYMPRAIDVLMALRTDGDRGLNEIFSSRLLSQDTRQQIDSLKSLIERPSEGTISKLLPKLSENYPIAQELETLFLALPPNSWSSNLEFLNLIGNSYQYDQQREQRENELFQQLLSNELNSYEFALWMQLRLLNTAPHSEEELKKFADQVASLQEPSTLHLSLIAQLFAKYQAYDISADVFVLMATTSASSIEFENTFGNLERTKPLMSVLELCEVVRELLPQDLAETTVATLINVSFPNSSSDIALDTYHAFVMDVVLSDPKPAQFTKKVETIKERINEEPGLKNVVQTLVHLKLARHEALKGDSEEALTLLKPLFEQSTRSIDQSATQGSLLSGPIIVNPNAVQKPITAYGIKSWPGRSLYDGLVPRHIVISGRAEIIHGLGSGWLETLVDQGFEWLDDEEMLVDDIAEFMLVLAFELHPTEHQSLSEEIILRMANFLGKSGEETSISSNQLYRLINLVALELSIQLPIDFIAKTIERGVLDSADEVRLLNSLVSMKLDNVTEIFAPLSNLDTKGYSFLTEYQLLTEQSGIPLGEVFQESLEALSNAREQLRL